MQQKTENTDVLIVGAGPSGLMMACQLAIHGIPFRIIEKREKRSVYSGALILQARSLEIFSQMGIAEEAINQGIIANKIKTIFNSKNTSGLEINNIGKGFSEFPFLLMLEQSKTEELLLNFLASKGYFIEKNTELISFSQDNKGVHSTLRTNEGSLKALNTKYLIGADGAHSDIRKKLNIPFIGKSYQLSLFVIDCKPETKLNNDEIHFSFSNKAITGFFSLKRNRWRIDGAFSQDKTDKLSFKDIEKDFAKKTRIEIKLNQAEWFSVFNSHQKYAKSFQNDNCFLIGDAAHIHSPVGAQGMNTGIQDAYNLAWKLAFVIKGYIKPKLLKTYSEERQPIAKKVIRSTDLVLRLLTSTKPIISRLRLVIFPPLFKALFYLIEKSKRLRLYFFKHISETGIHYRNKSLSFKASFGKFPSYSPKPGDRLPYILFTENGLEVNIQKKITGIHFYLFLFINNSHSIELTKMLERYNYLLKASFIHFSDETEILFKKFGIKNEGFILVRPDMYIACKSDSLNMQYVEKYLDKCGIYTLEKLREESSALMFT